MLGQQEAGVEVLRKYLRGREAFIPQRLGNGDEGHDILCQMRQLAIGQAVADRWSVRHARSIHQHARLAGKRHTLIGACGCIAGQEPPRRVTPSCIAEELPDRQAAGETSGSRTVSREMHQASVAVLLKPDGNMVLRQVITRPFRPFDKHGAILHGVRKAEFVQFGRIAKAVKVEMGDRHPQVIGLNQREGWTWHLEFCVVGHGADRCARQRALACAEVAVQRHHVARFQCGSQILAKPDRGGLAGECQRHIECRHGRVTRPLRASRRGPTGNGRSRWCLARRRCRC